MEQRSNFSRWGFIKDKKTVYFKDKMNSYSIIHFITAINHIQRLNFDRITVDFSQVKKAFPERILPIITTIEQLRLKGINVRIVLPKDDDIRKLFRSVNWAFFLNPEQFDKSESTYDRHLVTKRFENAEEQKKVVDEFMDVLLGTLLMPKDIISGIEWSINEITDNVLNHANSSTGGLIQARTYDKEPKKIVFAVVDSGRGILKSMQEGYPEMRTELQAIGEAIKAGVTRNPKYGQGNGLAGSLRIIKSTGGSLEILSGNGRLKVTEKGISRQTLDVFYNGTMVCGEINLVDNFSISNALDFDGKGNYVPLDIIDLKYEMEDKDCLSLIMKEETTGFGSRNSGLQIRTKVKNLLLGKPDYPLVVDWEGVPVISSSFADEFIGKLFLELGAMRFTALIRNKSMEPLISGLLDKAIAQRLIQAKDDEI
jgi:anti-sigma regulatory factor (Ser/Thr protein kinase)